MTTDDGSVVPFRDPSRRKRPPRLSPNASPGPTPVEVCDNFEPYRLIQARQLAMLSRADLAEKVGTTAARVAMWESGAAKVPPHLLEKIAEAVEVPPGFFARGRPMFYLSEADCHFRPSAYGKP